MSDALLVDENRKFTLQELMKLDTSGNLVIPVNRSKVSSKADVAHALQILLAIPDSVFKALHNATLTPETPGLPVQEEQEVRCPGGFGVSPSYTRISIYVTYLVDEDWRPPTARDYEKILDSLESYAASPQGSLAERKEHYEKYVKPIDEIVKDVKGEHKVKNERAGGTLRRWGGRNALLRMQQLIKDLREEMRGYEPDERLPRPLNYVGWTSGLKLRTDWAAVGSGTPVRSVLDAICRLKLDKRYTMRTIRVFDQFDCYQAELAEHIIMHAAGGYGVRSMSVEAAGAGTHGERSRPQTYWEQLQAEVMASPAWNTQIARQERIDAEHEEILRLRMEIAEHEVKLTAAKARFNARMNEPGAYQQAMQEQVNALEQSIVEHRSWRMMLTMARLLKYPFLDEELTDTGTTDVEMTDTE